MAFAIQKNAIASLLGVENRPAEKKVVLSLVDEAFEKFQAGYLTLFDALVGETACQFRAYKIAVLFAMDIPIAEMTADDQQFIALSYMLTKTKKVTANPASFYDYKDVTAPEQLGAVFSKKSGGRVVKVAQRILSQLSVEAIGAKLVLKTERKLSCTPFFGGVVSFLDKLAAERIPLLLHVDVGESEEKKLGACRIAYRGNEGQFEERSIASVLSARSIVVIEAAAINKEGVEAVAARVRAVGIRQMVMRDAALHPQLPKGVEAPPDAATEEVVAQAKQIESSGVQVQHIFAATPAEMALEGT